MHQNEYKHTTPNIEVPLNCILGSAEVLSSSVTVYDSSSNSPLSSPAFVAQNTNIDIQCRATFSQDTIGRSWSNQMHYKIGLTVDFPVVSCTLFLVNAIHTTDEFQSLTMLTSSYERIKRNFYAKLKVAHFCSFQLITKLYYYTKKIK